MGEVEGIRGGESREVEREERERENEHFVMLD